MMTDIAYYQKQGRDLTRLLLANSFPIAVKMLRSANEIPENALRPIKDLKHHIAVCQGFAMSRREGKTVASLKEDMWCFEPVVGFGLAEPPVRFLEGHNRYPNTAKTLQAGKTWARNMPRLPMNTYIGVVSAPLEKVEFEPDLVIVYCDNAQLTQLLMAANWIDGHDVESRLSAHAACVYTIATLLEKQNFSVCAPCQGDHRRALAQDNEIIFGIPINKLSALMEALNALDKNGLGLPVKFTMALEYELEPSYAEFGAELGINTSSNKTKK